MGSKSYDDLVRNVVSKLGIDRGTKKTTNQSLRPTTFNAQVGLTHFFNFYLLYLLQDLLGCTPAQKRLVSGHILERTADICLR
jgi:hypothetical protein